MRDIDVVHHVNQGEIEYYYSSSHAQAPRDVVDNTRREFMHYIDLRHSMDRDHRGLYGRFIPC